MIVVALIAIAAGVVSLALRDPASTRLETEAARLSALLESARAESRASGLAVRWVPLRVSDEEHFRFVGLPDSVLMPRRWLDPQVSAEVADAAGVLLGPEPLIGAQRIVLRLSEQRIELATDGLGPFAVSTEAVSAMRRQAHAASRSSRCWWRWPWSPSRWAPGCVRPAC